MYSLIKYNFEIIILVIMRGIPALKDSFVMLCKLQIDFLSLEIIIIRCDQENPRLFIDFVFINIFIFVNLCPLYK